MISWINRKNYSPIGVDIGSRSVKLVQFDAEHTQVLEATRWDLPNQEGQELSPEEQSEQVSAAIIQAMQGRNFRGRDVVMCLSNRELFLQNIRVQKSDGDALDRLVQKEAVERLPFEASEAEIRYIDSADVRQGDDLRREVILMACHRPVLEQAIQSVERANLCPIAVDVEPAALLRGYMKQLRRDEDRNQRVLFVHIGYSKTAVVISQGEKILFIKYLNIGGKKLDESVSRHLQMSLSEASAMRRHNGDRRSEKQDPEITDSIAEAVRQEIEQLAGELSMCIRYQSVTFRRSPLARMILGGGEASQGLQEMLDQRLDVKCELGDPLRSYQSGLPLSRRGQWDVAAGLALREPS